MPQPPGAPSRTALPETRGNRHVERVRQAQLAMSVEGEAGHAARELLPTKGHEAPSCEPPPRR